MVCIVQPFGQHDVLGCYIDLDSAEIAYTKNGIDLGVAFEIPVHLQKSHFYPAVVLKVGTRLFMGG